MTTKLIAFHGSQAEKDAILKRLQMHHDADEIVKGRYWASGKGCAVGCTIHSSDHARYETLFGIPEALAHLEDTLFENLAERLREAGELAVKATTWEGASTDPFERCVRAALAVQIPGPHIADRVCSSGDMEAISGTCYLTADQMKYVVAAVLAADRRSEVESGSEGVTDADVDAFCNVFQPQEGNTNISHQRSRVYAALNAVLGPRLASAAKAEALVDEVRQLRAALDLSGVIVPHTVGVFLDRIDAMLAPSSEAAID